MDVCQELHEADGRETRIVIQSARYQLLNCRYTSKRLIPSRARMYYTSGLPMVWVKTHQTRLRSHHSTFTRSNQSCCDCSISSGRASAGSPSPASPPPHHSEQLLYHSRNEVHEFLMIRAPTGQREYCNFSVFVKVNSCEKAVTQAGRQAGGGREFKAQSTRQ